MRIKRIANPIVILSSLLIAILTFSGCGNSSVAPPKSSAQVSSEPQGIEPPASRVRAVREALRYAEDANPGSKFKAKRKKIICGWARISIEETGVPTEEAVAFDVYLKKKDGEWEVEKSGTDISPEDLPGAPEELFK